MNQIENEVKNFVLNHKGDWIGIHDTHKLGIANKIENVGLCVSYNPYGRKVRRFKDENGKIDLTHNFMTTMYFVKENKLDMLFEHCVEYVIVDIPKEVLNELNLNPNDEFSYQDVCGYGFQSLVDGFDPWGFPAMVRGDIEPRESSENANVRLMPPYFISGHINSKDAIFDENPKHFSKLSTEEQQKIITKLKLKIKKPSQPGDD